MNILCIALKHLIWRFWICNYFREHCKKFREICFWSYFVKFKYLAKKIYIKWISRSRDLKWCIICSYFKYLEFFGHPFWSHWESFRKNLLMKSRNQNIFEKFKLNRNCQMIPLKIIYNMSMLRRRFSNEQWGAGASEPPSTLIL